MNAHITLINFEPTFRGIDRAEVPEFSDVNFYYHHFLPMSQVQLAV